MEGRFGDPAGGYYLYGAESEALVVRPKETYDGAVPSGNAMAALVLLRLSRYTGEDRWRQAAERQLQFLRAVPGRRPSSLPLPAMCWRRRRHRENRAVYFLKCFPAFPSGFSCFSYAVGPGGSKIQIRWPAGKRAGRRTVNAGGCGCRFGGKERRLWTIK